MAFKNVLMWFMGTSNNSILFPNLVFQKELIKAPLFQFTGCPFDATPEVLS